MAPRCSPGCPATHLLQGSGAGQAETSCFLCHLFIPAPSAAARPTRPANPRPRVAEAGNAESGDRFLAAGTDESTRVLRLAGPGSGRTGERTDRRVLQRRADRRSARGPVGGAGGGAAVGAAAAEEPAARSEAAPCRGPATPLARVCGYGGAGLEPWDPLVAAYNRGGARIQPRLAAAPPDSPAADVPLSSLSGRILGLQLFASLASGPADLWNPHWDTGATERSRKPPTVFTAQAVSSVRSTDPLGFGRGRQAPPRGGATLGPAPESTSGSAELGPPDQVVRGPDLWSRPHERGAPGGL